MNDPSNPLSQLIQQAAQIKGDAMKQKRAKFEKSPQFLQHTIFQGDDIKKLRSEPLDERCTSSTKLRAEGNSFFIQARFEHAISKYEEALGLFTYCYTTDKEWRTNGLDDESIIYVDDAADAHDGELSNKIFNCKVSCYLNLAAAYTNINEWALCITACNSCLSLDASNVKALWRRAQARLLPPSCGAAEEDLALADLMLAYKIDPSNKDVVKQLKALKKSRAESAVNDKNTFKGLFDRGEIYTETEKEEEPSPENSRDPSRDGSTTEEKSIQEGENIEQKIAEAERLIEIYRDNGKFKEADELEANVKKTKERFSEYKSKGGIVNGRIDFANPTREMIEEAKGQGLDLRNPYVRAELYRLQKVKEGVWTENTTDHIASMSEVDIRAFLTACDIGHSDLKSTQREFKELQNRLRELNLFQQHSSGGGYGDGEGGGGGAVAGGRNKASTQPEGPLYLGKPVRFWIVFAVSFSLMMWRAYSTGLLGQVVKSFTGLTTLPPASTTGNIATDEFDDFYDEEF